MLVTDTHRNTAIVIRNDGQEVTLVPMAGGRLSALHLKFGEFRTLWSELAQPLPEALAAFIDHAARWGATQEVKRGLEKLLARDRQMAGTLF
ncbi:MAG TPA: hypothetical protein PK375_03635 [Rhodocyclaceae bacterium]|mgnify:CR=1 FL=1|nr:hypothetical protein [Rhodocyclaceae bacterium]HNH34980.1 hypothetical protein [Rhodocyclaceae bacterium]